MMMPVLMEAGHAPRSRLMPLPPTVNYWQYYSNVAYRDVRGSSMAREYESNDEYDENGDDCGVM
jgi:hypothetical protein